MGWPRPVRGSPPETLPRRTAESPSQGFRSYPKPWCPSCLTREQEWSHCFRQARAFQSYHSQREAEYRCCRPPGRGLRGLSA